MKYRAAAGQTSHNLYPVRFCEIKVYLGESVLITADYHRRRISPEHEYIVIRVLEQILF